MGKPYDGRMVEYAFVKQVEVRPNQKDKDTVFTQVDIRYDLLNAAKKQLGDRQIQRREVTQGLQSVEQIRTLVDSNLASWVAADKLELSGYQEV